MMAVNSVVAIPHHGGGRQKLHPHLVTLLKWCASMVWGSAAVVIRKILELQPPALPPLAPVAGVVRARLSTGRDAPHISHVSRVQCKVLHAPREPAIDVIFVHGLYGSLSNTWRQGCWRKQNSTIDKIQLRRHSASSCTCTEIDDGNEERTRCNKEDATTCQCADKRYEEMETRDICAKDYENWNTISEDCDKELQGLDDKYLLSSIDIVDNYKDIMTDILSNNDLDMIISMEGTKSYKGKDTISCVVENCDKIDKSRYKSNTTNFKEDICECQAKNKAEHSNSLERTRICEVGCGCICKRCYSDCWPRDWVPVDFPQARVISINYTSDPNLWRPIWIKERKRLRLHERAQQMTEQLAELGVGSRRIVWVGHSKGGLFIKQIYAQGHASYARGSRSAHDGAALWLRSAGFMFYSVPHRGSALANLNLPLLIARSIELLEMGKDCADVLSLQSRWLEAVRHAKRPPLVSSLVETQRTLMAVLWLKIVSEESADAGIGGMWGVSVDHREICKPSGRRCPLYTELCNVLQHAFSAR